MQNKSKKQIKKTNVEKKKTRNVDKSLHFVVYKNKYIGKGLLLPKSESVTCTCYDWKESLSLLPSVVYRASC